MPPQELVTGNDFFNLGGSLPRLPTGMPHPMLAGGWMPPPPGNTSEIYLDITILILLISILILIFRVRVLHPPVRLFLSLLLSGMGAPFRLPGPGQAGVPMPMPGMALPPGMMPPGGMRNFAPVHYPSQDPTRMGANDGAGPSKPT